MSLAILDINPFSRGHCLVIPKRHVPWWHDLTEEEVESLFRVARTVSQKMMRAYAPDFVAIYARGRRIPHTHIFLVPTYDGDVLDRFFNALEGFQEGTAELAKLKGDEELVKGLTASGRPEATDSPAKLLFGTDGTSQRLGYPGQVVVVSADHREGDHLGEVVRVDLPDPGGEELQLLSHRLDD
jgi:histidine triad (HIT) family protein